MLVAARDSTLSHTDAEERSQPSAQQLYRKGDDKDHDQATLVDPQICCQGSGEHADIIGDIPDKGGIHRGQDEHAQQDNGAVDDLPEKQAGQLGSHQLPGLHRQRMHQVSLIRKQIFIKPVNEIEGADDANDNDHHNVKDDKQGEDFIRHLHQKIRP